MATMGDFASLLQLGFGIGVGLSVFRAPMELRASYLARSIDSEIKIVRGINSPVARRRLGHLSTLKLTFNDKKRELDRENNPYMISAVIGALLNIVALIIASFDAERVTTEFQSVVLTYISIFHYVVIGVALEITARRRLDPIRRDLEAIRRGLEE